MEDLRSLLFHVVDSRGLQLVVYCVCLYILVFGITVKLVGEKEGRENPRKYHSVSLTMSL